MRSSLIPAFLSFALFFSPALSFNVTVGSAPTQCGSFNVSWTGGQAPFTIMLTPAFDVPMNVTVPSSAFTNNQGSYQISPILLYNQTKFVVTMSDATGFGTGGTSDLVTVGLPVNGASCSITPPTLPFTFELPTSLQQCSSYTFSGYGGATLPVTVTGLIPGGESFSILSPSSGTSFSWVANVAAGNTIIFTMTDAQGRSGGSSDAMIVTDSNSAGCLDSTSPSSTISSSPSLTSAPSSSTSSTPTQKSTNTSTGTIVGAVVGGVAAVAAIAALIVCCLRRQRYRRSRYGLAPTRTSRRPNSVELDPGIDNFQHPPIYPFPYQSDSVSRLAPPVIPSPQSAPSPYQDVPLTDPSVHTAGTLNAHLHSRTNSNTDSFAAFADAPSSSMSSSGRRKAAMAGIPVHQSATRFIVHTDAEDGPDTEPEEIVELPPQYSERRPPATGRQIGERPMSSVTEISSTSLAYLSAQPTDDPTSHPPLH